MIWFLHQEKNMNDIAIVNSFDLVISTIRL